MPDRNIPCTSCTEVTSFSNSIPPPLLSILKYWRMLPPPLCIVQSCADVVACADQVIGHARAAGSDVGQHACIGGVYGDRTRSLVPSWLGQRRYRWWACILTALAAAASLQACWSISSAVVLEGAPLRGLFLATAGAMPRTVILATLVGRRKES
jgi:hypothetical protein